MLIKAMNDYPFPASNGKSGDLQVFLHGLPEDQRGTYPFVCVRWASGSLDEDADGAEGRETLALVVGMFAPEGQEQAGLILAELLDWLRAVLRRNRVVAQSLSCNTRSSPRCRNRTGSGPNIITLPFTPNTSTLSRPHHWTVFKGAHL